ncbi:MAG: YkgJ family cysteine cluster protein [Candidatus Omnitrophica bacterium]|nr:YkgJ family cysteine cluster protein [Candidatus Omnitrophota bacterium]MDD5652611.1 YkgJ family cysteine cluster protein [Candidatus Omnitrophota bacterium]
MIEQFVPQEICLKCQGCCRFREENSVWAPCLLDEEVQALLEKENLPACTISLNKRINPVANPEGEGFICPFLNRQNQCRIYSCRPFECQLYPFLINLRNKKVLLTVDLNCPYVKENLKSKEFKDYSEYLAAFLDSPEQKKILHENPQLLVAYEEVSEIIELNIEDETK